jgi:hypothetical protein
MLEEEREILGRMSRRRRDEEGECSGEWGGTCSKK